jgi:ribose transport system substrate-binding protein
MQESADETLREKWLGVPFTGCDGLIATGQQYVRSGLLAATVVVPPNTKLALEMLVAAMQQGKNPSELALTAPTSFPSVEDLKRALKDKRPRTS